MAHRTKGLDVSPEGPGKEKVTIYDAYIMCVKAFQDCAQNPHLKELSFVEGELARFKAWGANIGSSRDPSFKSSLDFRLRNSINTQNMVVLLLRSLRISLGYASKIFEEPEDVLRNIKLPSDQNFESIGIQLRSAIVANLDEATNTEESSESHTAAEIALVLSLEALRSVHSTVNRLQRLSIAIRRASAREYNLELARERDMKDGVDQGADDEICMRELIKHRFEAADPDVCDALVNVNSFRMRRFRQYKRRHDQRVRKAKVEILKVVGPLPVQRPPSEFTSLPNEKTEDTTRPFSLIQRTKGSSQVQSVQASEAFTFKSELFNPPKSVASSVVSSATALSTVGGVQLYWPNPPNKPVVNSEGDLIYECPFCFDILEKDEATRKRKWRKHLKKDLEPYNCFNIECTTHLKLFNTDHEWLEHVRNKHTIGKWVCQVKSHKEVLSFSDEEIFKDHMRAEHKSAFPESRLHVLVKTNYRPHKGPPFTHCPLGCSPDSYSSTLELGTNRVDTLARHIANHLLSLALESIPLRGDIGGSETGKFNESDDSEDTENINWLKKPRPLSQAGLTDISYAGSAAPFEGELVHENTADDDFPDIVDPDPRWLEVEPYSHESFENSIDPGWLKLEEISGGVQPSGQFEWFFVRHTIFQLNKSIVEDPKLEPFRARLAHETRIVRMEDDCEVAWICATASEYHAAVAFLDEVYEIPVKFENTEMQYTMGRIGVHKIVISSSLSDNDTCVCSDDATEIVVQTFTNKIHSTGLTRSTLQNFTNIRLCFLVGVAGGAPTPSQDIRLGDVVVGMPTNDYEEMIMYDLPQSIKNNRFSRVNTTTEIPKILLDAVDMLRADYRRNPYWLQETVDDLLQSRPEIRHDHHRPDVDVLLKTQCIHPPEHSANCIRACVRTDLLNIEPRARQENRDAVKIHYGLIASSTHILRDATVRDTLARERGVLCFDSEAIRLADDLPCLVIRGICDYSDSHTHSELYRGWKRYAAITAAAYAKNLLQLVTVSQISGESKIHCPISEPSRPLAPFTIHYRIPDYEENAFQDVADEEPTPELQAPVNPGVEESKGEIPQADTGPPTTHPTQPKLSRRSSQSSRISEPEPRFQSEEPQVTFSTSTQLATEDPDHDSDDSLFPMTLAKNTPYFPNVDNPHLEPSPALERSGRVDVESWLSPSNTKECLERSLKLYSAGTGTWFLESEEFAKWKSGISRLICLQGPFGVGKTILSSKIIDILQSEKQPNTIVLYFFFHHQTQDEIFKSLVMQAYSASELAREKINALSNHIDGNKLTQSSAELALILESIINSSQHIFQIVIDAIDECMNREGLLKWVDSILSTGNCYVLVTSRPTPTLDYLSDLPNMIQMQFPSVDQKSGIHSYIRDFVYKSDIYRRWISNRDLIERVRDQVTKKSNGMYLLAKLQIELLQKCESITEIEEDLTKLPTDLESMYDRILQGIGKEHESIALGLFRFLIYAEVPLTLDELVDALAVDPFERPEFEPAIKRQIRKHILTLCPGLIVAATSLDDTQTGVVQHIQFVHSSLIDYFTHLKAEHEFHPVADVAGSHGFILNTCLAYLGRIQSIESEEAMYAEFPFGKYSWENWSKHAVLSEQLPHVSNAIYQFLMGDRTRKLWCRMSRREPIDHPLYDACELGLAHVSLMMLESKVNPNSKGGVCGNPLQIASAMGHADIVESLLRWGAESNAEGGHFDTALCAAAESGHADVVELLLQHGARTRPSDDLDFSASGLERAAGKGHGPIVQLLLGAGAEIGSALVEAIRGGHEQVTSMLLDAGADPNHHQGRALREATQDSHEGIVELLLRAGADPNLDDGNALIHAAAQGYSGIIDLLLDAGADPNIDGGRALVAATVNRHERIVERLLAVGADPNLNDSLAFLHAAAHGDESIVKLLLAAGAHVNARDGLALQKATEQGDVHMVRLLVAAGAGRRSGETENKDEEDLFDQAGETDDKNAFDQAVEIDDKHAFNQAEETDNTHAFNQAVETDNKHAGYEMEVNNSQQQEKKEKKRKKKKKKKVEEEEVAEEQKEKLTEEDIHQISVQLSQQGHESWSRVPRLHTVLTRIGRLQDLENFLQNGLTDLDLPFKSSSDLDGLVDSAYRADFLHQQYMVLAPVFEHSRPQSRNEFEVAIICPSAIDAQAVRIALDEYYDEAFGRAVGDRNADYTYRTGRIGVHNVVMVFMPSRGGRMASTRLADSFRFSFTHIKLVLVIGICSGVPATPKDIDIYLGDVIISTELVKCDSVRQYTDGLVSNTLEDSNGRPYSQATAFLHTIQGMLSKMKLREETFSTLQNILHRFEESAYPGRDNDLLYESTYQHKHHRPVDCICVSEDRVCDDARSSSCLTLECRSGERVARVRNRALRKATSTSAQQVAENNAPVIHFGRMLSGNIVFNSGIQRDEFAERAGVIGFEMENAGVWNRFPTIVIKSVCDYADGHKNKDWQKYTSAAAVACMKALLHEWPSS